MGEALGCISRDEDKDIADTRLSEFPDPSGQERFGFCINDRVVWNLEHEQVPKGVAGTVISFTDDRIRVRFPKCTWNVKPQDLTRVGNVPSLSLGDMGGHSKSFSSARSPMAGSSRSLGAATSARWTATARSQARESARVSLERLREGNLRYLSGGMQLRENGKENSALDRVEPCAIVATCTPSPAPVEVIFGLGRGELACVASASLERCIGDDGGTACMEFSMSSNHQVHLMVVMETLGVNESTSQATQTVWNAIEQLMCNSEAVRASLRRGAMFLHGALLEMSTGQVRFLGEHMKQAQLIAVAESEETANIAENTHADTVNNFKVVRKVRRKMTANLDNVVLVTPIVPAEEALAALQAGNARAAGKETSAMQTPRAGSVDEAKHEPFAVVFMGFDPHRGDAPLTEMIFDTHPSNLATISLVPDEAPVRLQNSYLRSARELPSTMCPTKSEGDEWQGYVHLAEHCIGEHSPRLLLVLFRIDLDASDSEKKAVKNEVFENMLRLLRTSKLVKAGVSDGQLQVEGALYTARSQGASGIGHVEWLGAHPEQAEILHKMHINGTGSLTPPSSTSPTMRLTLPPEDQGATPPGAVDELCQNLRAGNRRYLANGPPPLTRWRPEYMPKQKDKSARVLIVAGANGEVRPAEYLFDTNPGDIVVHRTCGGLTGRRGGCSLSYLENLLRRHTEVQLLLILGDVLDPVVHQATTQVQRIHNVLRCPNAQMAVEQLGPPVIHAWRQMQPDDLHPNSQQQQDLAAYATELHVIYRLERVLRDSELVLSLVHENRLEVQGAVAQKDGSVKFLGGHDNLARLFDQRARTEKHRRKGLRLGPAAFAARQDSKH